MKRRVRVRGRANLIYQLKINLIFWSFVVGVPIITWNIQQSDGLLLRLYNEFMIRFWETYMVAIVVFLFGGAILLFITVAGNQFARVDRQDSE